MPVTMLLKNSALQTMTKNRLTTMIYSKIFYSTILVLIFVLGTILTGCSDDEILPSDHDVYSVTAINAGSDMAGFSFSGQNQVFCYEDGCENSSGFTSWNISPDGETTLMSTDPERSAVGLIIEVNMNQGEGYLEIEGFNIDPETFETSNEEVILTTDLYSEDEVITVSWGNTEGFEDNDR